MAKTEYELTHREIVERIWRAVPGIVRFWIGMAGLILVVILFWPRTYGSTSRIYLQRGRESVGLDPTANATGKTIALQQAGRDAEIKSALDVIGSRGILEPVVDKLGPDVVLGKAAVGEGKSSAIGDAIKQGIGWCVELARSIDPASERERAIIEIEKNMQVEAERKSEVISVTFESETPELAQLVTTAIIEEYQKKHSELQRTEGSTGFFEEQSQRLRNELEAKSNALREAKNRMGLASISGQRAILEKQLGVVRHEAIMAEKSLFAAQAMADNLANQLRMRPERMSSVEKTVPNSGADMQRQLLYQLQIKLAEARAKFTGDHPQVRTLEDQVAQASSELQKQVTRRKETSDDINPVHEALRLEYAKNDSGIAGFGAQVAKLKAQEADLLREIRELNAYEVEIQQLEREVKVADKKFLAYAESLEEAQVDQAMQAGRISSVRIAQPATLQEKPVAPSKPIVVLVGGLLSVLGAIAIAFANIQFDDTINSTSALRKQLGVPVLGALPLARKYANVST